MCRRGPQLAYFAGLLDGEGCICIKRSATSGNRFSPSYVFSLCIEMADPRPIKAMCKFFNLRMRYNTSRHRKNPEKHRFLYVAQIGQRKGIEILEALLPHLKAKRDEAKLAIEFHRRCHREVAHLGPGHPFRGPRVSQAMLDLRHKYYLKLQALKTRSFQGALRAPRNARTAW